MIEVIAGIVGTFYCADKAYSWFNAERDRKIKLAFTERRLVAEERAANSISVADAPMRKMAEATDRISRKFTDNTRESK
jgi:hypothetical protein